MATKLIFPDYLYPYQLIFLAHPSYSLLNQKVKRIKKYGRLPQAAENDCTPNTHEPFSWSSWFRYL